MEVAILMQMTTNITANESHVSTLANAANNGCDSIVTENITSLSIPTETVAVNVCMGDDYTYADATVSTNVTADESHVSTLTNGAANGCDSIVTENITVLPVSGSNQTLTSCDSLDVNGVMYYSTQIVRDTLTSINTCDSIVVTDLTINITPVTNETHVSCDSLEVNGTMYYSSQMVTDVFSTGALNGCDSVVVTDLTINITPITSETQTSCDSLEVNGTMYYTSQMVYDTLTGLNCDSIVITDLTINNAMFTTEDRTSCGDITINGTVYTSSQVVLDTFVSGAQNGCDSTHTTNLTVSTFALANVNVVECITATVFGMTYSVDTIVSDTIIGGSIAGCDTITVATVTINFPVTENQAITECVSATINGNVYTADSIITDLLTGAAANGCDSTIITDLTIINRGTFTQDLEGCDNVDYNGTAYTVDATVMDTVVGGSANGCDSIITTNIVVHSSVATTVDTTINQGGSIMVGNSTYTTDGTYIDSLSTSNNCDSIITTNLTVTVDGINSSITGDINIYPNPTKGVITIKSDDGIISNIKVVDVQGKELMMLMNVNKINKQLDISNLADGIYFMKLTLENGSQSVIRVTKMK